VRSKTDLVEHTMQTNPAVEQNKKNIRWSENPWNEFGRREIGLWRKGFAEEPCLKFRKFNDNLPPFNMIIQLMKTHLYTAYFRVSSRTSSTAVGID